MTKKTVRLVKVRLWRTVSVNGVQRVASQKAPRIISVTEEEAEKIVAYGCGEIVGEKTPDSDSGAENPD